LYSLFFIWNPELFIYLFIYSPQPTPFSPTLFSPSPHSNLSPELGAWATRSPWQRERWSGAPKQRRPRLDYARMLELGATTGRLEPGNGGDEHAATWDWQRACRSLGRWATAQPLQLGGATRAPHLGPAASVPQRGGGGKVSQLGELAR